LIVAGSVFCGLISISLSLSLSLLSFFSVSFFPPSGRYHLSLVSLLATIAQGENEFVETLCKRRFSVEQLLSITADDRCMDEWQDAFGEFLFFLFSVHTSHYCVTPFVHDVSLDRDSRTWYVDPFPFAFFFFSFPSSSPAFLPFIFFFIIIIFFFPRS
jgi:hypothetical protein